MHVSVVARLTGLKPVTIRMWERRYRAVVPSRDRSGRRVYAQEDIDRLSLLATLVRRGHRIGTLAHFDTTELRRRVGSHPGRAAPPDEGDMARRLIEAARNYDQPACLQLAAGALIALEPLRAIEEVLAPLMRLIGDEWAAGRLDVAQEHALSSLIAGMLHGSIAQMQRVAGRRTLLIAAPAGERHELGCLFAAYLAASRGVRCVYLGADVPARDLVAAAEKAGAEAIALSLPQTPVPDRVAAELAAICARTRARGPLWIGGEGAAALAREGRLPASCPAPLTMTDFVDALDRWAQA